MKELEYQFHLIQAIRNFFNERKFLDVLTPPMVKNPGMETHIHPFEVISTKDRSNTGHYLHTSPEFFMKDLLSQGFEKIFTISYCFRDEPNSEIHRKQFLMLEWYRANMRYESIMDDTIDLFKYCAQYLNNVGAKLKNDPKDIVYEKMTIQELFLEYINVDILKYLEINEIKELIKKDFKEIKLGDENLSWDDYYFLLFLNYIEPKLTNKKFLILYEYPHHLSALSTIKKSDPRVCERFELYIDGIEIANCFNELTDIDTQKKRFDDQHLEKSKLYNYSLPEPDVLYLALQRGLPASSGIALGVERFLLSIIETNRIFFED